MLNKIAYTQQDRIELMKSLANRFSISITNEQAADLWSLATTNAKRRFKNPPQDFDDILEERLGMYSQGYNFARPDDSQSIWHAQDITQDDYLGRNLAGITTFEQLKQGVVKFLSDRAGDMQRQYRTFKQKERTDSEIGLDDKGRGVTQQDRTIEVPGGGMGGRETAREFPYEKWQEYSQLSSANPQIGQAVEEIQAAWEDLIENYLADKIINKAMVDTRSQFNAAEEKVMFYGAYDLSVNIQGATVPKGNIVKGVNPFKGNQTAIAWYLFMRALQDSKSPNEIFKMKIDGATVGNSSAFQKYGKFIQLAMKPKGTGKSWDQTNKPSDRLKKLAIDAINKGEISFKKHIQPIVKTISRRAKNQGDWEQAIYSLTNVMFNMNENLSYENWLPAGFKQDFPELTQRFVDAFEKLDIGLAAYANQRRFAKKNQKLITRVAYRYILQNEGQETHIEKIASAYIERNY